MKVSVIIPVYNVSKYIERCLLSVLNQTWQDLEVILVNDCTPDDSVEVAEKVLAAHPRREVVTILHHEKNGGLSAARNTGIRQATGDYLYFLDSDDYLPLNSIELLAKAAEEFEVDFVIGDFEVTGASRWAPPLKLKTGLLSTNKQILSTYSKDKWYVMAWNKLVNRNFLLQKELFFQEGIVHEDDLWSFMLACQARKAYVVKQVTYYYYIQPNSITGAPSQRNLECRMKVIEEMCDYIVCTSDLADQYVYHILETSKAKYFDRILYFSKDRDFHYNCYLQFRKDILCTYWESWKYFRQTLPMYMRGFHLVLPPRYGFIYFKTFVKMAYYLKVLPRKFLLKSRRFKLNQI